MSLQPLFCYCPPLLHYDRMLILTASVVDVSVKNYQYTINKNNTIQKEINYEHDISSTDCLLIFIRVFSYFRTQSF